MKTSNTKTKHYKKAALLSTLIAALCAAYSCSDNDSPKPDPEPDTSNVLRYQSMAIAEFKQITSDNKTQDIPVADIEKYFGERTEMASPNLLRLTEDSIYITKPGDLTEGYKMKWDGNKLLLYKEQTDTWEHCGEQKDEKQITLNTGFYIKRSEENSKRQLTVIGQEYSLENYSDIADHTSSTIWLRVTYTFE
ncbi:hypothetical protein [Phocaeicola sp.]